MLLFHLLLLLKDLRYDNFFVFLLFVEAVPEFTFNPVHLATSQVKELFGSDGLFLVEVASQLKLFLDVAKRVLYVVHVIFHFLDLLLGKVLQHLYVMHGTTMVLEAFGAQGLCVTQAIIDVIILVLGANILVAYYPSMACYGPSNRLGKVCEATSLNAPTTTIDATRTTSSSSMLAHCIDRLRQFVQVDL